MDPMPEEEVIPRIPGIPFTPTAEQREHHEATGHATYRPWCESCISGKARRSAHRPDTGHGDVPEISFDFAELALENAESLRILVCKATPELNYFASTSFDFKSSPFCISFVRGFFEMLGYRRVILRSDGEAALISTLREAVAATPGLEAIFRTSPPDDPQANGAAERAVQEVKAHSKVLVADLRGKYPGIDLGCHVFSWVPRHAAASISRYRILECGRTAEELRSGRKWRRPTILFGEVAHFMPAGQKPRGAPIL